MNGISRQADYAARIVLHLACLPEGSKVSIREISAHRHLPVPFVRRLVAVLVEKGILRTFRGSAGGVRLARPAAAITLLDVVRAMQGPISLSPYLERESACPISEACPVNLAWGSANQALEAHFASIQFKDLAEADPGHAAAYSGSTP
jgi:Rrf2 family protein